MDDVSRLIWDTSRFRGNALLMLFRIAECIGEGNPRPKIPDLALRLKVSIRQAERLESELKASGELIVVEAGGRGLGNRYEIPMIRPLLIARFEEEWRRSDREHLARALSSDLGQPVTAEAVQGNEVSIGFPLGNDWEIVGDAPLPDPIDMDNIRRSIEAGRVTIIGRAVDPTNTSGHTERAASRSTIRLVESPTNLSPFDDDPTETTGQVDPTKASGFHVSPTDSSGFDKNVPTKMSRQSPNELSLPSPSNTIKSISNDDGNGGPGGKRRRGRRRTKENEIPFPDDFELDAIDREWFQANIAPYGLSMREATLSWADRAIQRGWTAIGMRGWKAAWRNGMRKALEFAVKDGKIIFDPGRPAPSEAAPMALEIEDEGFLSDTLDFPAPGPTPEPASFMVPLTPATPDEIRKILNGEKDEQGGTK